MNLHKHRLCLNMKPSSGVIFYKYRICHLSLQEIKKRCEKSSNASELCIKRINHIKNGKHSINISTKYDIFARDHVKYLCNFDVK